MKILVFVILISLLDLSAAVECDKTPKNDELRLKKDMLCNYDKSVRPLGGSKNATLVKVKMVLKSYDYLDYSNKIDVLVWMVMSWTDDHFKWNPQEYGNLKIFYEMSDAIWTPDLALYNSEMKESSCETTNCVIDSNGLVICVPPCQYTGHCAGSFKNWPYDRQNCTLTFGAWINTGEEINFFGAKNTVDSQDSLLNHDWKLLSITMKKNTGNYSCCPNQTFPSLRYNLILERHSSTYTVYLLIPTLVMVLINIISLLMSPRGNERWILIAVSFIGHIMFLQQLSWTVPKNGATIPSILIFYRDSTSIIAIMILNTVIVKLLLDLQCDVPVWLSSPVVVVKESAAGKLIVSEIGSKNMERIEEVADDDTAILVEPKPSNNKNSVLWKFLANLIDRLCLIAVILTYFFLIILLVPEDYASAADLPSIEFGSATTQN
ncbi:Neurotransmitter-gated ion-channel ligand-binding domain [Sergentomyia squamirostris]